MTALLLAFLLSLSQHETASSQVIAVERVDAGVRLSGADYLLIAEAARHPAMGGMNLSCFNIEVFNQEGTRRVAFIEARNRFVEERTPTGTTITYLPPDPNCRSITFVMGTDGRVSGVIYSRH